MPMSQNQPRRLRIVRVRDQGRDIRSFDLMPEHADDLHGVAFIPGQVGVLRVGAEPPATALRVRRMIGSWKFWSSARLAPVWHCLI